MAAAQSEETFSAVYQRQTQAHAPAPALPAHFRQKASRLGFTTAQPSVSTNASTSGVQPSNHLVAPMATTGCQLSETPPVWRLPVLAGPTSGGGRGILDHAHGTPGHGSLVHAGSTVKRSSTLLDSPMDSPASSTSNSSASGYQTDPSSAFCPPPLRSGCRTTSSMLPGPAELAAGRPAVRHRRTPSFGEQKPQEPVLSPSSRDSTALVGHPWSSLLPAAQAGHGASVSRPFSPIPWAGGATDMPGVYQGQHQGFPHELGVSCRNISWTGQDYSTQEKDALELDAFEDQIYEEDEEEYGCLDSTPDVVDSLTMAPSTADAEGLSCPFSWKELEQSCRQLDQANIRIDQIDLSCIDDVPNGLGNKPKVLYNFHVQAGQRRSFESPRLFCKPLNGTEEATTATAGTPMAALSTMPEVQNDPTSACGKPKDHESLSTSDRCSGLGSLGTASTISSRQGSLESSHPGSVEVQLEQPVKLQDCYAEMTERPPSNNVKDEGKGLLSSTNDFTKTEMDGITMVHSFNEKWKPLEDARSQRHKRLSSLVKSVKAKCGLIFTSSALSSGGSRGHKV